MRCPSCNDEFEPHVTWCASCHVELVPEGAPAPPRPPGVPDARLGRFHPAVGQALMHRWALYNETLDEIDELEAAGDAVVFRPERVLVRSYERRLERLTLAYAEGLAQARREVSLWREFGEVA